MWPPPLCYTHVISFTSSLPSPTHNAATLSSLSCAISKYNLQFYMRFKLLKLQQQSKASNRLRLSIVVVVVAYITIFWQLLLLLLLLPPRASFSWALKRARVRCSLTHWRPQSMCMSTTAFAQLFNWLNWTECRQRIGSNCCWQQQRQQQQQQQQ